VKQEKINFFEKILINQQYSFRIMMNIVDFKQINRDSIQFTWNNPKQHLIHAIQRSAISDVPTLCIDMVMIDENTSMLADQELALRLGMIPMDSTHVTDFLMPDECDCENFCHKCCIRMSMNVSCYEDRYDVTSKDLYSEDTRSRPIHESSLPEQFLGEDGFGPGILLVPMRKNQRIRLSCIVRKGTGKIHGKWNSTSKMLFVPLPKVNLNMKKYHNLNQTMENKLRQDTEIELRAKYEPKCKKYLEPIVKKECDESVGGDKNHEEYKSKLDKRTNEMIESIIKEHLEILVQKNKVDWQKKWLDSCPRGVFKDINGTEEIDLKWWTPANDHSIAICNACIREAEEVLEGDNLITVGFHEDMFSCKVVGTGVLSPKEILLRSIHQLKTKFIALRMELANMTE
jgi:DNA-directed RNA polymerase alpha subunit